MRALLVPMVVLLGSCRGPDLQQREGTVRFSPALLEFPSAVVGQSPVLLVRLLNDGPPAKVSWTLPSPPFYLLAEDLPPEVPSGALELSVRFSPQAVGAFSATVWVEGEGLGRSQLALKGAAAEPPDCPPPSPCHRVGFDLLQGRCVEAPLADGAGCGVANRCLSQPACLSGRCVGLPTDCDDSNACTTDTCNPTTGCEHQRAPPCPGDGKCQRGACDPATGCFLERAEDGAACGSMQTCDAAEVCLEGACVVRDPPDGHVCAEASPCRPEGRCAGSVCVRPPASTLHPTWSYDAVTADAGVGLKPSPVHDVLLEPDGAMTLAGPFAATPLLRHNTPQSKEPALGLAGRCLLWNGRLVCSKPNDVLSGVDLATGATLWSFSLRTARPDFVVGLLFVAHLAVQSSDRLAVLWEGYPERANCRLYFLSILDAAGALVSAQQLSDPALVACNHPHAYGFVADGQGTLFIAFAPTIKNPPLISGAPTATLSFTRDGVFRWRRNDVALKGGELAVARGLLYPEHSPTAIATATGQPAFTLAQKFGRAVVGREALVLAPQVGGASLGGYEPGSGAVRWAHPLGPGQDFGSAQVRLATWSTRRGPQTVALTFTREAGQTQLRAILAWDGTEAFSCPVSGGRRTEPQQLELADGFLAVMDGADGCATCEPAFSDRAAAFRAFAVPTLSRALLEPWVGAYGGPGHDRREQ